MTNWKSQVKTCRKSSRLSNIAAAALYFVPIVLPFILLISGGINIAHPLLNERRLGLMVNSLQIALLTVLICAVISVFACIGINRLFKQGSVSRWFFMLMAPVPSYIHALCYMSFIRIMGKLFPGLLSLSVSGITPCIIVECFCFLPFACAAALTGMDTMEKSEIKAALLFAKADKVFFKIILPKLLPYVTAMGAVIFVLSITDYTIPSLFQVNVYAMEIFSDYSASGQSTHSLYLSLPPITTASAVIILFFAPLGRISQPMKSREGISIRYSKGLNTAGKIAVLILILQIILPLLSLVSYVGAFFKDFVPAFKELFNSMITGAVTVLIIIPLSFGLALLLSKTAGVKKLLLMLVAILPLSVPGALTGIAVLKFFSDTFLYVLRDSVFFPAFGMAVRYMPYALLIQYGCYIRMDRERIDAAYLLQKRKGEAFFKVKLAMMAPGIMITSAAVFLLSLGDVGTILMLMSAGREPLSVKIYNYLHYGQSEAVAVFCLMQITACLLVMAGMFAVMKKMAKEHYA